ncbi:M23 family metallopeptidase [Labilibacter marinus]|uniref:M23 family metallopeptidase n=1 Tax=Labilibacter marinus TaxID=1477105 RepID=UPI000831EC33|nr:M23 family metallopeptidase [Labilibacter marinus]
MAKSKYIYDPESLTYIQVEITFKDRAKKLLPYVLASAAFGVSAYFAMAFGGFGTPKEKIQAQQIDNMKVHQELLDERINDVNETLNLLVSLDDSLYRSMLGEPVLGEDIRIAGTGGTDKYEDLVGAEDSKEILEAYKKLDGLVAKMNVQQGSYKELFKKSIVNKDRLQHMPAIIPVANWDLKRIGSGFSPRRFHPILKKWRQHEGIDFIARTGTDVYASADGKVKSVRYSDSFGKMIEIDHGFGITTLYAHLSKQDVRRGDEVKRGVVIGHVGNTGLSAGAHLHYEVHVNGVEVDPVKYFFSDLTSEEYKAVVAQAQSVKVTME